MKILFMATHFNTGGITSYLLTLSKALIDAGHEVHLASVGGNMVEEFERIGGTHYFLSFRTKSELDPRIYLSLSWMCRIIKENKIEIIHAHTRVMQVMGWFLQKLTQVPFVATCHGFYKPRFFRRLFPCWGESTVAISEPVKDHLIRDFNVPTGNVHLITNGIDLEKYHVVTIDQKIRNRVQNSLSKDDLVIGHIARLADVKGQEYLVAAMPYVLEKFPKAKLFIVGEGKMEMKLREQVQEMKLYNNIFFFPVINKSQEMLSLFDVFVMPSIEEGLGLSILEAQACGLPVVATRVGGIPSIVEDGKTGILVEKQNAEALGQAIIKLLENPDLAHQLSENARQFIVKHCPATKMCEDTLKMYQKVLNVKS